MVKLISTLSMLYEYITWQSLKRELFKLHFPLCMKLQISSYEKYSSLHSFSFKVTNRIGPLSSELASGTTRSNVSLYWHCYHEYPRV